MALGTQTFRDLIAANKRNSTILVVIFCLFVAAFALVIGLGTLAYFDPSSLKKLDVPRAVVAGVVAAGVALILSFLAYYNGSEMVLGISGARPIEHAQDPELFNVVEEMAIAAGIPMPRIYLIDDSAPNAFATGRDPQHAVVAITTGLRYKLTRDELQAVMAHEISHIRNYDIRLMLLLAVLVGTVVMLADFFWQILRFSSPRRSRSDGKGGNIVALVIVVLAIVLSIIAPILATILQLAVSRQREYLADASAVQLTRYPQALAEALRKIDADHDVLEAANRGTAHLFFANPIKRFEERASTIFASHPPIQMRIQRIESLVREQRA